MNMSSYSVPACDTPNDLLSCLLWGWGKTPIVTGLLWKKGNAKQIIVPLGFSRFLPCPNLRSLPLLSTLGEGMELLQVGGPADQATDEVATGVQIVVHAHCELDVCSCGLN